MPNLRAVLTDPDSTADRPIQIVGTDRAEIDRWANDVLKAAGPAAVIKVYLTIEVIVDLLSKASLK